MKHTKGSTFEVQPILGSASPQLALCSTLPHTVKEEGQTEHDLGFTCCWLALCSKLQPCINDLK